MNVLPSDLQRYCTCMEEINSRLLIIEKEAKTPPASHGPDVHSEQIAVQFRKILELMAFGSLIANRSKYSQAYSNYTSHWKAKDMLANLVAINPAFYPVPLKLPVLQGDGTKHFPSVKSGYLTNEQFVSLYDHCGSILHTHNPYALKTAKRFNQESTRKWLKLVRGLLNVHLAKLIDRTEGWAVFMCYPEDGLVHAFPFQALDKAPNH